MDLKNVPVLVIGAGLMGAGIAQVAAQAGHQVLLFDAREGAAAAAKTQLAKTLAGLVAKGRLTDEAAQATLARIQPLAALADAAGAGLVIEAIVENLDAKRALLRELEAVVGDGCVLASNTSSISITALGNGLRRPQRLVGLHFFNPVPLMKLVEVVHGLQTDAAVADAVFALARAWGKTAVHCKSTPGFIVNRIARPFYAEALALLQEQAATPEVLDACLRGAGFRMGPCELMDLIGHDTNFAVTRSVYEANFFDKRFVPSLLQREMVDGGLLGRKSGRGFYDHAAGSPVPAAPAWTEPEAPAAAVVLHGTGLAIDRWAGALSRQGRPFTRQPQSAWCGLQADAAQLRLTDGRTATACAREGAVDDLALFDLPLADAPGAALAWAAATRSSAGWQAQVPQWLALAGFAPLRLGDAAGLAVARTVAMLVNEAADAVLQGVCTPEAADLAMTLGVNYPRGPFQWLDHWGSHEVVRLLDHLDHHHRGERYRVSPWLRQQA